MAGCAAPLCGLVVLGLVAAVASVRVDSAPADFRPGAFLVAVFFCLCALVIAPCGLSLAWFFCDGMLEGVTSKVLWRRRKEESRARAASLDDDAPYLSVPPNDGAPESPPNPEAAGGEAL